MSSRHDPHDAATACSSRLVCVT
uniref:Uncharacterized protein n=1 Tax=Caenorhabditis japonica TaxID=281687 RepID=A0A8R1EIB1_CAEJA